jgi:hypothetical protein
MCFWFGIEILRLVYKKVFLKYWTVSILFDLSSLEKSSPNPHKMWKKISSKLGVQGIKRSGILHWFKKSAEVTSLAKGKTFFSRKTEYFGTWKILPKIVSLRKNLGELLDARVLHIFKIRTKFHFFWYPARPISKNFFFNCYKGRCSFFGS